MKSKMLQLLGIERAYVPSVGVHEEASIHMDVPFDYSHSRKSETAFLKAETKKLRH